MVVEFAYRVLNRSPFYFFTDRRNGNWRPVRIRARRSGKTPGIGSRLPTYRLITRNSATIYVPADPAQGMTFCNIGMSAFLPYLRINWTWPELAASTMSAYRRQRAIAPWDNSKAKSSEVHSNSARVFLLFHAGEQRA